MSGLDGATAPAAGGLGVTGTSNVGHTCALVEDASVMCWANIGNFGTIRPYGGATPGAVPDLAGATAISAGTAHSCALLADGTVK